MKLRHLILLLCTLCTGAVSAQKQVYIPNEWKNPWPADSLLYKESDPDNKYTWSKSRSAESNNFIVFWDKYYGTKNPTNVEYTYRFDIQDLLKKAEEFFALNVNTLAFADPQSNVHKYKMMILLNHTTDWVCYGGGYDFVIGALWLSPSTSHPVGSAVAHEIGHSFQYMAYTDKKGHSGFHDAIGMGSTIWEQTAQWQSVQSFPGEKYSQSTGIFLHTPHYAFTHEWQRYQSYWYHYYLAEKYGIDIIGKIWRYSPVSKASDFNEVLMKLQGWKVKDLYASYFDYAMHIATWDLEVCKGDNPPIGQFTYNYLPLEDGSYQVAYSSCPQSTGFNVIPLNLPAAGEELTTYFMVPSYSTNGNALAPGDPAVYFDGDSRWSPKTKEQTKYNRCFNATTRKTRGFRLGYVALMEDGSREYIYQDSIYCAGGQADTCALKMTLPTGVDRLFLVVSPAPSQYFQHQWDDDPYNDDQWPYSLSFRNTCILGAPVISNDIAIHDVDIYFDVHFPRDASGYTGTTVSLTGAASTAIGTAFQMNLSQLASHFKTYATAGPKKDQVMLYPLHPSTGQTVRKASTANEPGHWFNASGTATDWGSGYLFSEFHPDNLTFALGQYPGRCVEGKTYTIGQALKYSDGTTTVDAKIHFRVTIDSSRPAGYAVSEVIDAIHSIPSISASSPLGTPGSSLDGTYGSTLDGKPLGTSTFDLQGRPIPSGTPFRGPFIKQGRTILPLR